MLDRTVYICYFVLFFWKRRQPTPKQASHEIHAGDCSLWKSRLVSKILPPSQGIINANFIAWSQFIFRKNKVWKKYMYVYMYMHICMTSLEGTESPWLKLQIVSQIKNSKWKILEILHIKNSKNPQGDFVPLNTDLTNVCSHIGQYSNDKQKKNTFLDEHKGQSSFKFGLDLRN